MSSFWKRFLFVLLFLSLSCALGWHLFSPIFSASSIVISFAIHPFDICLEYPEIWKQLKLLFVVFYLFSHFLLLNSIYTVFFTSRKASPKPLISHPSTNLHLFIGKTEDNAPIYLPEASLYQNILITGTIRHWQNK